MTINEKKRNIMNQKNTFQSIIVFLLIGILTGCVNNQNKEIYTMKRRIINPWTWQDKYGFVQSNEITDAKRMLFTAGIVSVDKDGNLLYPGDIEKQTNQILDNMEILLKQANYNLSDVVRFTYYTTNVQQFTSSANEILVKRLQKENCKPATSLIGVASLYHPDCVIEIEAIVAN